ncbi:MAG: PAS domain S-box protein [Thermodesulfobacteriota bacterium]
MARLKSSVDGDNQAGAAAQGGQSGAAHAAQRELECLYAVSELLSRSDLEPAELLQKVTEALRMAFAAPDAAQVRLTVDEWEAATPGFVRGPLGMQAEIAVQGRPAGRLEVHLDPAAAAPEPGSDPFGPGLARLLADTAQRLGRKLDSLRTRQAMEEARVQWEATFNAVPDLIAILDRDHRVLRVNRTTCERLGLPAERIVGRPCHQVFHGSAEPMPGCPHVCLLADGKVHMAEARLGPDMGEFLVSTSPIRDDQDRIIGSVHVARDLAVVKRSERAYQEQVGFLERLLDTIPNPVYFKDAQGRYTGCNAAFAELMGRRRDEIVGRSVSDLSSPELAELYLRRDQELWASPGIQIYEAPLRLPDGSLHQVIFNKATYTDGQGRLAGIVGVIVDITTNKLVEQALRDSEERYRTLVEMITEGMLQVDEHVRIRFFNDRLSQMLGYDSRELYGRSVTDFLDDDNREVLARQVELRRQGGEDSYELAWTAKDGRKVHTIVYPKAHFNQDGEFRGAFALIVDVTERKALERQLMQAQKLEAIGSLAAGIAHEINTPTQYVSDNTHFMRDAFLDLFRVLAGYSRLATLLKADGRLEPSIAAELAGVLALEREVDSDYLIEEVPKAIEQTLEGLARISKIVRSMKEFAHPGPEGKTPTDLNKALENTVTLAKNEWKYVAEVELDLDPELPPVPCVPSEINQVFLNIIVNAAQALAEVVREGEDAKGRISIRTRRRGGLAEITISDNGPGIPPAIQSRVFDPFFTTKPPGKGTGQGLAIAQRVVADKHQGSLLFSSQPGQGATFVVRLPLDA